MPLTSNQAHPPRCIQSLCLCRSFATKFSVLATKFRRTVRSSVRSISHDSVTMPNRGRRNPRKLSRTRQGPAANALNNEQTNYRSMATEALRLLPGCTATHSGQDHSKLSRSREDRLKSSTGSSNSSRSHP